MSKRPRAPRIARLQLAPNSPLASELMRVLACGEQIYSPVASQLTFVMFCCFASCFAQDVQRNPLGRVSVVLYPQTSYVKMNADGSIRPLINDVLLNISCHTLILDLKILIQIPLLFSKTFKFTVFSTMLQLHTLLFQSF